MKSFRYTVKDPLGIHARPAGLLAKLAKEYPDTDITLTKGEDTAKAGGLMRVMSLAIKRGDEITVTVNGGSEDEAFAAMQEFFEKNL